MQVRVHRALTEIWLYVEEKALDTISRGVRERAMEMFSPFSWEMIFHPASHYHGLHDGARHHSQYKRVNQFYVYNCTY